jgi:hypothetical protein
MDVRIRRFVSIGMAVVAMMAVGVPTTQAAAPSQLCLTPGAGVVPVTDRCANRSYGEWAAAFWKYALAAPAPSNPLSDPTGANCQVGQAGPVFFLPGTFDGSSADRPDCVVPAGKAIFFPVINIIDVSTPPGFCIRIADLANAGAICDAESPDKLRADIKPVEDSATGLVATIDGVTASPDLAKFRVQSPAFSVFLPDNNLFGVLPRQAYMAVADGYYIMLAPLSPGQHTIHFGGATPRTGFTQDNTYTLQVAAQ